MFFETEQINRGNFARRLMILMECEGLFDVLPISFVGNYKDIKDREIKKEDICKKDKNAAIDWYKALKEAINSYILIEDDAIKTKLLHYLIYSKYVTESMEKKQNKYVLIYKALFG